MKILLCGACLLLSVVLALSSTEEETDFKYASDVVPPGGRTKRSAALAFLVGVGAGGLFGPILYNRLYGWGPRTRPKITFYKGWEEASSPQQSSAWATGNTQGWQKSSGWEAEEQKGWQSSDW